MAKKLLSATMAFLALGALDRLPANLIIDINQTGANDPVSVDSPRAWNFGVTSVGAAYFAANGLTFDSALFDAKVHKDTTAPLVFTLYSGLGGNVNGNSVLATISMPATSFNQQYQGGELFTFKPQLFTTGYYSVTLTSTAPDSSTQDYFLKQGTLSLLNSDDTVLNSAFWLQDQGTGDATTVFNGTGSLGSGTTALAPEPNATWAAALIAGFSIGGSFLRRSQKKPALAVR